MKVNRATKKLVTIASGLKWDDQKVLTDIEDELAFDNVVNVFKLPLSKSERKFLFLSSLPWHLSEFSPRAKIEDLWGFDKRKRHESHVPVGNICPDYFVIGDAPGYNHEEGLYRQWVSGPSSKLLRLALMMNNMFPYCWFTNQLRHSTPGNRASERGEIDRGRVWLENEVKLLQPRTAIVLGSHSYNNLSDFFSSRSINCVKVVHPAYALRQGLKPQQYADKIIEAIVD